MSSGLATYGANALLDGTALPQTLYLQPHIGNPGAAGTANVAAETNRKAVTWGAASAGVGVSDIASEWLTVTATETWTHWTLRDAASGGNVWFVGEVLDEDLNVNPLSVNAGANVIVEAGAIVLAFTVWS